MAFAWTYLGLGMGIQMLSIRGGHDQEGRTRARIHTASLALAKPLQIDLRRCVIDTKYIHLIY